ncbi:MAG: phosphodiesterase [Eubacteriales bacterium]|nr:phosphodiesterase [Eubacteriales bacterium]MDY3332210.1 phosphodiesterase [Gallibacter sp.]
MKMMIVSDIHGSAYWCRKMIDRYKEEGADRLLILGDILYHGPRNDLPEEYNPKAVIEMLNPLSNEILCVRGNCDSEVDQMVLNFSIMADYSFLNMDGISVFVTHGHIYNRENLPSLKKGDYLLNGHFHIPEIVEYDDYTYLNPGSISIPKGGSDNSYMIFEDGEFVIKTL